MAHQFAISVHDIDAGGLARSFDLPLAWLALALGDTDVTATAPGHADLRLSKTGHDIVVRGKVTGTLSAPCARCLAPTAFVIDTELSLLLRPAKSDHGHGHSLHGVHAAHGVHGAHGSHGSAKDAGAKDSAPKDAAAKDKTAAKDAPAKDAAQDSATKGAATKDKPAAHKPAGKDASKSNGHAKKSRGHEEEEYEFSSEEADTDVYDGELVVLDDFIREALLLEVPSFPLCSEDCPGIRPTAKATSDRGEPAIDPRLSPLRALKTKLMLAASPPDAAEGAKGPPGNTRSEEPAAPGPRAAAPRKAAPGKSARPKIQAHRTLGAARASGAQSKARTKHSPNKKAK